MPPAVFESTSSPYSAFHGMWIHFTMDVDSPMDHL